VIVTPYDVGRDPLDPVRYIVETGSADGVIFSRTEPQDARVRYLHERGFPFATHGRSDMGIEHPFFDFDNARYAELAVERLAARGRRRLALLGPPTHLTYSRHMTAGFQRAVERLDLIDVPIRTVTTDSSYEAIRAEVGRLMTSRRRPDGIVCGSAAAGISAIGAAEESGCVIGRDLDLAVKESFNMMRKFRREIEVVQEDFRRAGMALADAVVRTIGGAPASELQTLDMPGCAEAARRCRMGPPPSAPGARGPPGGGLRGRAVRGRARIRTRGCAGARRCCARRDGVAGSRPARSSASRGRCR
jgi:LacI family transcriptional regulator